MGVQTRIILYAPDQARAEQAAVKAFARISALDAALSDYRQDSELSRLCALPAGTPVRVSDDLWRVLTEARRISDLSGGAFDVSVGPASKLWRKARREGALPDQPALAEVVGPIDYRTVELNIHDQSVRLGRARMELDLGGIAKCDAAQQARDALKAAGFPRAMVALAGDISVGQPPPGMDGWTIGVIGEQGGNKDHPLILSLRNTCVSTSGDTEQFIEIQGRRFSHIIDPKTGLGTPGGVSVTIVDPDGAKADALATAACVVGADAAADLITRAGAAGIIQTARPGAPPDNRLVGEARVIGLQQPGR